MKPAFVSVALAFLFGCCTVGHSDPFPARPVTMIVPFPAGGPTDTLARILAERMRVALGQPIVIENVTGAGASIGVARAAQAAPDGHTLSIGNWTSHVGAGAMYQAAHDAILETPTDRADQRRSADVGRQDIVAHKRRERDSSPGSRQIPAKRRQQRSEPEVQRTSASFISSKRRQPASNLFRIAAGHR